MIVQNPLRITHQDLITLAEKAKGRIDHVYLHWTAGNYQQCFDDYHLNIDDKGNVYQTCASLTEHKAHTYQRNTGAIGVALCCAYGASMGAAPQSINLGAYPPTTRQMQSAAWVIAFLCSTLGIEIKYPYVMTHAEAAIVDGYGPFSGDPETRWDLYWLHDAEDERNKGLRPGGAMLRTMAYKYADKLKPQFNGSTQLPLMFAA